MVLPAYDSTKICTLAQKFGIIISSRRSHVNISEEVFQAPRIIPAISRGPGSA